MALVTAVAIGAAILDVVLLPAGGRGVGEPGVQLRDVQLDRLHRGLFAKVKKADVGDEGKVQVGNGDLVFSAARGSNVGDVRLEPGQGGGIELVLIKNREIGAV